MAKLTITGNTTPIVGETEMYSLSLSDRFTLLNPVAFSLTKIEWNIHVQDRKGWRITNGNLKEGTLVTYKFTDKSLQYKALKIEVIRGKDKGDLYIKPQPAENPGITHVELLDIHSKRIPKGKLMHYTDTIIVKAYCVGMFGQKVAFTLWEDDATGKGHDPVVNMMNKINRIPLTGEVDHEGVARVVFRLPAYTLAVQIANAGVARGDNNEGKTHEYYVTAEVISKHILKASPNVNVANPGYIPPVSDQRESKEISLSGNGSAQNNPKPKENTAKFPQTPAAKKQADPEGKILGAEFTDGTGKTLKNAGTGDIVSIKITSQNMKGKSVKVKIWEEDLIRYSNDLLYEIPVVLAYDTYNFINGILLTRKVYAKGNEWGEGSSQEYFIEVEHLNTSVTSRVIPINPDAEPVKVEDNDSVAMIKEPKLEEKNCGGKYCIDKNSLPSELIREINIRLAGFGGNVPSDKFIDRTERMIKQFQRDYMKVFETGKICGNVLRAIDEFSNKYPVNINEGKCPCKKCTGFGNSLYQEEKNNTKILEKRRKYEYPGIHRSLLWVEKAIKFYLDVQKKQNGLRVGKINSGYRCNANNKINKRHSTNHMGKALDIHIYKLSDTINTEKNADIVRDLLIKYTNAKYRWSEHNVFALEPSSRNRIGEEYIATTWVHYDVRTFDLEYLKDEYFVKDNDSVNGESITVLARRLGFQNTCNCNVVSTRINKREESKKAERYRWAHSKFGNLIAKVESSDDYNKCNKTEKVAYNVNGKIKYKRIVKVVNSVKVIETTIKEIQKKQSKKDLFAVGRYQLIPKTLNSAISTLNLDINKKLDQEMQDRIFDDYLIKIKRPKIISYLEENGTVEDAMYSAAQEWASIGVEKGKRISDKTTKSGEKIMRYAKNGESYYAGDGLNKAHVTPEEIKEALIHSKNENK
ncbi:hypothetical protein [Chryseobacterium arthrosphaerae]|uniref:hypothetical protein n=1 Tax=Chryseobacterium arthrosphaerae TaxID=651561 RepID=UPI00241C3CD1|nr:hypothetical protein [Chryseobacterium arthrosphaerae]